MKINKDLYFKSLTGYKISGSHFELGSNLHIKDYYYAKRLFYNSFYTNRFAFLIVEYITKKFEPLIKEIIQNEKESDIKNKQITLLGCENYSELLISNVRKMLNDFYRDYNIVSESELFNHDIYTKDGLFLKNPSKIGRHIISIYPISTTFSTSLKIQNEIKEVLCCELYNNKEIVFHNPIINCLVITNGEVDKNIEYSSDKIEYDFGWEKIDNNEKIITIRNLSDQIKAVEQHYFLSLPSIWQKIDECSACYPDEKSQEICLIETKNNPATPSLIFDYPKASVFKSQVNLYELFGYFNDEPIIYRRHFKKLNNNFIYYIRTGVFFKKNRILITNWLKSICKEIDALKDNNIVIITPTSGSNSGFANLANDILFSDTATIIQYNPSDDYLHNFKIFYAGVLQNSDTIIFIDDVLFTTNTFTEINYYIKSIKRNNSSHGINACISLINRSGYYNFNNLKEQLNDTQHVNFEQISVFSFSNINVAPILHKKTFPFDKLTSKFKELSWKSVLDEMRIHFKTKENYFRPFDLTKEFDRLDDSGTPKELFQFLILNEFNNFFQFEDSTNRYNEEATISAAFEYQSNNSYKDIEKTIINSLTVQSFLISFPEYGNEVRNAIFKICTSEPFIQFKNIRESVFKWVLFELQLIIEDINKEEDLSSGFFQAKRGSYITKYTKYQELKFLLKRGTKLKMNYIYSTDVLKALEKVLRGMKKYKVLTFYKQQTASNKNLELSLFTEKNAVHNTLNYILEHDYQKDKSIYTTGFITYYIGLLQELIIDHESKALQTVINVKEIIDNKIDLFHKNLKNTYNDDYMNLLRMLVLENTFIFHSSSEKFLRKTEFSIDLNALKNNTNLGNFKNNFHEFTKTYSFEYTRKMLSRFNPESNGIYTFTKDSTMALSFENMILLKAAILNDKNDNGSGDIYVRDKIETILQYCCKILDIENGGAFFSVKYKNKNTEHTSAEDFALVGEYANDSNISMKTSRLGRKSILYNVYNGIKETGSNKSLSTFEVSIAKDGQYHFLNNDRITSLKADEYIETEDSRFGNLFYLRISEIHKTSDKKFNALPIAVLCFYDNKEIPDNSEFTRFDPKRVRQLLLLRNDINTFINNQLDNDSLRAYIEEQNQMIINKAITHSFDTYIKQFTDTVETIEHKETKDKIEILGTLIINKHLLLKFIAEYLRCHSSHKTIEKLSIGRITTSRDELSEIFEKFKKVIFAMELPEHDIIKPEQVTMNIILEKGREIIWYDFFYKELIFELLYNVRKCYSDFLDDEDKFELDIRLETIEDCIYLSFTNNLYNDLPSFKPSVQALERTMYDRKEKKGLSLINTISEIIYKKKCILRQFEDKFQILIPIEIK
jgi:hypothetical protein